MEKSEITEFHYSSHAIQRMFERGLYPDDKPFPSILFLGYSNNVPIHVVAGIDENDKKCYIITVYQPEPELWSDDYTKRR